MDDNLKNINEKDASEVIHGSIPVEPPVGQEINPDMPSDPYSSGYIPKPGEVIRPQHLIDAENKNKVEANQDQKTKTTQETQTSTQSIPEVSLEKPAEVLTTINNASSTYFPNPFGDTKLLDKDAVKAKAADLQKIGETVVKSSKFKKIMFVVLGVLIGIPTLIIAFNILWPILFPREEDVFVPPIVNPPIIREEPKEDKTSLRFLDGKIKELKPSLDELNNDSTFMIKLRLESDDFSY
ncbi:hypothetical protein HYV31_02625 [candidate division WWE3 bacterium]|nr:hypothetical protein [candidate division WWE3 bacterium]